MSTDDECPSDAFGPLSTKRFGKPATTVDPKDVMPADQCSARVRPPSPRTSSAYGCRDDAKPVASTSASTSWRVPSAATSVEPSTAASAAGTSVTASEETAG